MTNSTAAVDKRKRDNIETTQTRGKAGNIDKPQKTENAPKTENQLAENQPVISGLQKLPRVAPQTQAANVGDLLKYEADHRYSREAITVAAGQRLALGTLLGRLTRSGFMTRFDPEAADGSEVLAGVLLDNCDARESPCSSVMLARYAMLADEGLIWGALTPEQQSDVRVRLAARGILIQQGV